MGIPASASAQGSPDEKQILDLINLGSPGEPMFYVGDVTESDKHPFDFNGDGVQEWVVLPSTGCGETKNCLFYILSADKKKGWKLLLKGEGKITSLTPQGFVVSPRKTQGYSDLISVWDQGPETDGTRSLDRRIYTFNGTVYERFIDPYPPPGSPPELQSLLGQVNQLKYQKVRRRTQ